MMGPGTKIYLDEIDGRPGESYAKIESDLTTTDSILEAKEDLKKTFSTLGEETIVENAYFEL